MPALESKESKPTAPINLHALYSQLPLTTLILLTTYCAILAAFTGIVWKLRAGPDHPLKFNGISSIGDLSFGLAFFGMGMFIIFLTAHQFGWWMASWKWRAVDGTIVSSKVLPSDEGPGCPEIIYEFEVAGQKYKSQNVRFGGYDHGDGPFLVDFCYPGRLVRIYYDPNCPDRCCLQRMFGGGITLHATGFFFTMLGIVICIFRLT